MNSNVYLCSQNDAAGVVGKAQFTKALHSELELELLSRFSSQNEFLAISEVQVEHHFFDVFGKVLGFYIKFPYFDN